jgi:hypothetical protein
MRLSSTPYVLHALPMEPDAFEVKTAIEELKRRRSPDIDQILV